MIATTASSREPFQKCGLQEDEYRSAADSKSRREVIPERSVNGEADRVRAFSTSRRCQNKNGRMINPPDQTEIAARWRISEGSHATGQWPQA
jgi:hypothetical protein